VDIVQKFGMLVDIPAPGLNVGLQIGDAIDDGHGSLGFGCFVVCSTSAAIRPTLLAGCKPAKAVTAGLVPAIHV
jgi:hypothetical protein